MIDTERRPTRTAVEPISITRSTVRSTPVGNWPVPLFVNSCPLAAWLCDAPSTPAVGVDGCPAGVVGVVSGKDFQGSFGGCSFFGLAASALEIPVDAASASAAPRAQKASR